MNLNYWFIRIHMDQMIWLVMTLIIRTLFFLVTSREQMAFQTPLPNLSQEQTQKFIMNRN